MGFIDSIDRNGKTFWQKFKTSIGREGNSLKEVESILTKAGANLQLPVIKLDLIKF